MQTKKGFATALILIAIAVGVYAGSIGLRYKPTLQPMPATMQTGQYALSFQGSHYYVSPDGNGAHDGSSLANAFSLSEAQDYANSYLNEELTFRLASGEYGEFVEVTERTKWVTYKSEAGATVIFSYIRSYNPDPRNVYLHFEGITFTGYDDLINKRAALLTQANYVTFVKCNFVGRAYEFGDRSDAIYAYHANNITVEDCHFEDFDYGIGFRNVDDVNILNSTFYNLSYGIQAWGNNWRISGNDLQRTSDGIRVHCANSIIENNSIHNTSSPDDTFHVDAIQIFRQAAIDGPMIENVIFRNNHIYDNQRGQGIFGGMGNQEARNITFENNLIEDTAIHHFTVYNFKDIIFHNNTILDGTTLFTTSYNPDIHGPDPDGRGPTTIASMSGNILYRSTIDNTTTVNYENYNILWHWWGTWSGGPMENYVPGEHSIEIGDQDAFEALFIDYDANDFHLAPGSIAIDFGLPEHAPTTDLEGNPRDANPDAGAYEFQGVTPCTNGIKDSDERGVDCGGSCGNSCTFYLDPAGSDLADGTSQSPWQTMNHAKSSAVAGDTVLLRPSNYGYVEFADTDNYGTESSYITYKADPATTAPRPADWYDSTLSRPDPQSPGNHVIFEGLRLDMYEENGSAKGQYLEFDGINLVGEGVFFAHYASHLRFKNINVFGDWADYGDDVTDIGFYMQPSVTFGSDFHDILIDSCYMEKVSTGIHIHGNQNGNILFKNNHVYQTVGSGISLAGGLNVAEGIEINGNHVENQVLLPKNPGDSSSVHGSGLDIRINNVIAKNNIVHNFGNTQGIQTYQNVYPENGFSGMVFENNLVYDTQNNVPVDFQDIGDNFVVVNNTFVGIYRDRDMSRWHYNPAVYIYEPNNPPEGFVFSNNVLVGRAGLPANLRTTGTIKNNILHYNVEDAFNYAGNENNTDNLILYDEGKNFDASGDFFVGGADFDTYNCTRGPNDSAHGVNLNNAYKLAPSSDAVGFADTTHAPATDIESNLRDASPDAGAYEFQGQQCIDTQALLNYISQWKQGQITMLSLMQKIALWKAGCS